MVTFIQKVTTQNLWLKIILKNVFIISERFKTGFSLQNTPKFDRTFVVNMRIG